MLLFLPLWRKQDIQVLQAANGAWGASCPITEPLVGSAIGLYNSLIACVTVNLNVWIVSIIYISFIHNVKYNVEDKVYFLYNDSNPSTKCDCAIER